MASANRFKRGLYLAHRWLGILMALVMLAWFVSGVVMLYVGYPRLTSAERLAALPPLSPQDCCVPLSQAVIAARAYRATLTPPIPGRRPAAGDEAWRLTSVAGRPILVVGDGGRQPVAVDARSATVITGVSREDARRAARHFAQGAPVRWLQQVQEDAWTHSRALDGHRPLHLLAVEEPQARWLYVSSRTGEVVRDANLTERSWGWIGAWLHWLYPLRGGALDVWWADIVIGLALAGAVASLSGLVLGLWRWRFRGRYRNGRRTPYADRAARWHHVAGMLGGVLCLTWVLSGLFSMNPWKIFDADGPRPDRMAYAGGAADPAQAPDPSLVLQRLAAQGLAAREISWHRVGGQGLAQAHGPSASHLFVDADARALQALPSAHWRAAAAALMPGARIVQEDRLERYDAYYYERVPHTMTGARERPLPVWRLRWDDPGATWAVIDPRTGILLQVSDRHGRASRWLFAFLHSFDLPVLLASRPAWDLWMLSFGLAGIVLTGAAVVTGSRRLRRTGRPRRRRGPIVSLSSTIPAAERP
ncbi:MAG: PepSY domain-containing protein [Burkholderiales bacterium]|nr:PepSY domain-containing protein [Burkholderiales bacterium]